MHAQIPPPKPGSTSVRNPVSSANCRMLCKVAPTLKFSKALSIARSPSVESKKSSEQPGGTPYTLQKAASIVPEASSAIDFEISITHTSIPFLFLSPSRLSIGSFVFLRLSSAHVRTLIRTQRGELSMPRSRMNSRHFAALLADRVCIGCNAEGLEDRRGWRGRSEVLNAKFITPTFSPLSFALFVPRVYPPLSILRSLHNHRCYVTSNSVFVTVRTAGTKGCWRVLLVKVT